MPFTDSPLALNPYPLNQQKENLTPDLFSHTNSLNTSETHSEAPETSNNVISDPARGKELLTITVEIGNGQKENIVIFENDDAESISNAF